MFFGFESCAYNEDARGLLFGMAHGHSIYGQVTYESSVSDLHELVRAITHGRAQRYRPFTDDTSWPQHINSLVRHDRGSINGFFVLPLSSVKTWPFWSF